MVKNSEHISGSYLIFRFILIFVLFSPLRGQDTTKVIVMPDLDPEEQTGTAQPVVPMITDKDSTFYPGKPLLMSLIVPGLGQLYNKEPVWKPSLFIGTEILTLTSILYANKRADEIRMNYQEFADNNWSLQNWWNFVWGFGLEKNEHNGRFLSENAFKAATDYRGTHHLTIHLKGELHNLFNTEFLTSDSLALIASYLGSDDISMVKDRHYYENIGKYDQFVGGWSDSFTDWYWEGKDVGDSTEIVIKTPKKQDYLDERYKANQWLSFAKFSVSAMMFNHVFSGLEAVWANRNKDSHDDVGQENKKVDLDLGLLFNPKNTIGIGGLTLRLSF